MYDNILVAIDLTEDTARQVLTGALSFTKQAARLSVVHVVEPQYIQYSFDPTFTGSLTRSLEKDALAGAANRVAELCEPFGIPREAQQVLLGRVAHQIHELAISQNANLIIVGSHGHHGWQLLLGSTANAVLHGAPVDVAVIRIPKDGG